MSTKQQYYSSKYQNYQTFCRENSGGKLSGLFLKYSNLSFENFMIGLIKPYVLPNISKIDEIIEQKLLELGLTIDDVDPAIVDKFKRYLQLFCTFYE